MELRCEFGRWGAAGLACSYFFGGINQLAFICPGVGRVFLWVAVEAFPKLA
jgi:hypothetical protein